MTISVGKYRALQRASTPEGIFAILAIDHQDALKRALKPDAPNTVAAADMTAFKLDVVRALIGDASGVLLDPVYGAFQAIVSNVLGNNGLLVELEKADYQMQPLPLDVEIDPDWSVSKIKSMHADGVKLFFYYNPHVHDHAQRQEKVIQQVAADCTRYDIPFYAEPIVYIQPDQPDQTKDKLVLQSAQQVAQLGADVLKLEFPADANVKPDESAWFDACQAITQSINVPWVLLSAGVTFEMFARQLEVASRAGASGFIVGRALWGDAAKICDYEQRQRWLTSEGHKRLTLLSSIAQAYGTPWQERYPDLDMMISTRSFREYPSMEQSDD